MIGNGSCSRRTVHSGPAGAGSAGVGLAGIGLTGVGLAGVGSTSVGLTGVELASGTGDGSGVQYEYSRFRDGGIDAVAELTPGVAR